MEATNSYDSRRINTFETNQKHMPNIPMMKSHAKHKNNASISLSSQSENTFINFTFITTP